MTTTMKARPLSLSLDNYPPRSSSHESSSSVGLGLNFSFEGEPNQSSRTDLPSSSKRQLDTESTPRPLQVGDGKRSSSRSGQHHSRQISNGSEVDLGPKLDMALQYVSKGPLANIGTGSNSKGALSARRRGRALYLNDLLQYNSKSQAKGFHSALLQWQKSRGGPSDVNVGEQQEDGDMTVLLAQARSLAQSSSKASIDSPNPVSQNSRSNSHHQLPSGGGSTTRRRSQEIAVGNLTSASTPEGALGKVVLPTESDFENIDWDGSEKEEILSNSTDDQNVEDGEEGMREKRRHQDDQSKELETLRAGLRFVIGCYDDLAKQKEQKNGLSEAVIASLSRNQETIPLNTTGSGSHSQYLPPQQHRPRSRSILKTLARKSAAFTSDHRGRHSPRSPPLARGSSVVNMNTDTYFDDVSGPSNRYGMAQVVPYSFQEDSTLEEDDSSHPNVTRSKQKGSGDRGPRSRSSSIPLSPLWSRRSPLNASPSVRSEQSNAPLDMDRSALSSALHRAHHQLNRMEEEKKKFDQEMEELSESLFTEANEMVRVERIKSAALEKELETLKSAFSTQEVKDGKRAVVNADLLNEMGSRTKSEEEAMMLAAVTQSARATAEAEESVAEWKSHCEELQNRGDVLEEALYQAMTLLAEKLPHDEDSFHLETDMTDGMVDKTPSSDSSPTSSTRSLSVDGRDDEVSDSGSSFYSVGDDDAQSQSTPPFVSLGRNSGLFLKTAFQRLSKDGRTREKVGENAEVRGKAETSKDVERMGEPDGETVSQKVAGSGSESDALDLSNRDEPRPDQGIESDQKESMFIDDEVNPYAGHMKKEHGDLIKETTMDSLLESSNNDKSHVLSTEVGSAVSCSSPRSSTSTRSKRDSLVSSIRNSMLPPKLPLPTSPLPDLPSSDQGNEKEENVLEGRGNRASSIISSPALTAQSLSFDNQSKRSFPSTASSDFTASLSSPDVRSSWATSISENASIPSGGSLIDYSMRRKSRQMTMPQPSLYEGLPLLSTAGSLATASPAEVDTFGSFWSTPEIVETKQLPSSSSLSTMDVVLENGESSGQSKELEGKRSVIARTKSLVKDRKLVPHTLHPSAKNEDGASQAESDQHTDYSKPDSSVKSSGTKKSSASNVRHSRPSHSKSSILGHMPPLPSSKSMQEITAGTSSRPTSTYSGSIHSVTSPTIEHYNRLQAEVPIERKAEKTEQFSRKTRFNDRRV